MPTDSMRSAIGAPMQLAIIGLSVIQEMGMAGKTERWILQKLKT
jgi:hypothetical protein